MKQVGRFGLWVPEDTEAPDGPSHLTQLAEGTESTDGLNDHLARAGAEARRSIVTAEQSITSATFQVLGIADRIEDMDIDADDLLVVVFMGEFKSSGAGNGRAAIFVGGEQLMIGGSNQAAATRAEETSFTYVASHPLGLAGSESTATGTSSLPTPVGISAKDTRQFVGATEVASTIEQLGGACVIRPDTGIHDVEIRWSATSGSITARNRRLYAWTRKFA